MKKLVALMSIILAVAFITSCGSKDPKDLLLDEMIGAYGGLENLKKLDSYTSVWAMEVKVRPQKGKVVTFVEQSGKLRVELLYPNRLEKRVLNGAKGYRAYNNDPLTEVSGPKLDSMKLQMMRLYSPLTLKNKADIVVTEGEGVMYITLKEGALTSVYHVNATTFRIEKVVGNFKMGPRDMEFQTEYSDFKKVDGVLMHHKENKFAAGMNTAELFLKDVKLQAKHGEEVFN
ncbi:MAG: hypothetical protein IME98_01125 [Proteobacteria bacterium]|nr:hypothetical protein [Pseudomonadota bacterium]